MRFVQLLFVLPLLVSPAVRADEQPGFRWGVSAAPSLLVVGAPSLNDEGHGTTAHETAGGISIAARLGYQLSRHGLLGFGLYAEPRFSVFGKSADGTSLTLLVSTGSVMGELDVGSHFFFAAGITIGGQIAFVDGSSGRGPFMGGFTLRVGAYVPVRSTRRPHAVSIALEAMALFGSTARLDSEGDRLSGTSGTASLGTLGLAVGFDSL